MIYNVFENCNIKRNFVLILCIGGNCVLKWFFFVYGGDLIRDCFFNVDDYVGGILGVV